MTAKSAWTGWTVTVRGPPLTRRRPRCLVTGFPRRRRCRQAVRSLVARRWRQPRWSSAQLHLNARCRLIKTYLRFYVDKKSLHPARKATNIGESTKAGKQTSRYLINVHKSILKRHFSVCDKLRNGDVWRHRNCWILTTVAKTKPLQQHFCWMHA